MQDPKASGGRKRVFRCRSVLSAKKRARTEDVEPEAAAVGDSCEHTLWWNKKASGKWELNLDKSVLEHKPFCTSGQRVTKCELVNDPDFIQHVLINKEATGKQTAKRAIGHKGRMDGSISDFTARRARNTVARFNTKDYADDFCKLRGWGNKYQEQNAGARYIMRPEPNGDTEVNR